MKYTGSEIRDKSFEKTFRGYDSEEVIEFLKSLAEEWDQLLLEKNELERRLESTEREAKKLKDVEVSLFRTLKTAEDTGAIIIEEAKKAAEELLQEAHHNSDNMIKAAEIQSKKMLENAEIKSDEILEGLRKNIKDAARDYDALISTRQLVIKSIKKISQNLDESLSNSEKDIEGASFLSFNELLDNLDKGKFNELSEIESNTAQRSENSDKIEADVAASIEPEENPVDAVNSEKQEQSVTNNENEGSVTGSETAAKTEIKEEVQAIEQEKEAEKKEDADTKKNKKEGSFFEDLD